MNGFSSRDDDEDLDKDDSTFFASPRSIDLVDAEIAQTIEDLQFAELQNPSLIPSYQEILRDLQEERTALTGDPGIFPNWGGCP